MTNQPGNFSFPDQQSVPPDFFANLHNDNKQEELSYSLHRYKLQSALNLPANNRWVADWLFLDMQDIFHRNITLPPEAFDKSLPMQVMHHFFDVDAPACPMMRRGRNPPSPKSSQRFHTKGADMLLLPVASANGITVGYSFGSVRTDAPSQGSNAAFSGRFAFEDTRQELLVINGGNQPGIPEHAENLMAIMSFMWSPDGMREHYMILCPMRDYNYYNLPNEVLFFTSAEMHLPSKRPLPLDILALQSFLSEHPSPDVIDELLYTSPTTEFSPQSAPPSQEDLADIFELPSTTSDLPWFLDSAGNPRDNVGIPRRPGNLPTSSGAFNMDSLAESLTALEESLRGDFYGSRQSLDVIHPMAHPAKTPGMVSARNVVARISRTDSSQGAFLRHCAIRMYLSSVLSVASDDRFMTSPKQISTAYLVNPGAMSLQQALDRRARRIAPLPIASSSGECEGNGGPANEEEVMKEKKREAKRRRNRLSAARSNEKRRENWRMQQHTLESLRKRVQELQGRKLALATENKILRERVTTVTE